MQHSLNEVYNEDCLIGMQKIPDSSIDMVLCDLPYGTTSNKFDKRVELEPLWEQYKRICKENAAIVLFSQMPFGAELIMSNKKMYRYEWIWQKRLGQGWLNSHKMPLRLHENILVFYRKLPTYNAQKWQGKPYSKKHDGVKSTSNYRNKSDYITGSKDGSRYPVDVIQIGTPYTMQKEEKPVHPTQKPVALLEYLIKTYTNEGEVVLDNCIGSGSTAVACINTNRYFIGFEIEKKYCEVARLRIEGARRKLTGRQNMQE